MGMGTRERREGCRQEGAVSLDRRSAQDSDAKIRFRINTSDKPYVRLLGAGAGSVYPLAGSGSKRSAPCQLVKRIQLLASRSMVRRA